MRVIRHPPVTMDTGLLSRFIPSKRTLSILFATIAITGRVGYYIVTPLWLDYFKTSTPNITNETVHPSELPYTNLTHTQHEISVFFILVAQWSIGTLFYGAILLVITIFKPGMIGEVERNYPKKHFLIIGVTQGISSQLFNAAVSGTRTAPYLQAVLSNCNIPIQFIIR